MTNAPVSKNDIVEIRIDGLGYDGEGIAHINGYTLFIPFALPGEKVRALIILVKKTFAVGKLKEVLEKSPDRTEPFCPVYTKCGGCNLQHMKYEAQLGFKRDSVCETFRKAGLSVSPALTVPSPLTIGYRNKMSLPVRGEKIGFFAPASHRLVPVEHCPIQFDGNSELIAAFSEFMREKSIAGYDETTFGGKVRHLSVRRLDGFTTVTVVANGDFTRELAPFDKVLRTLYGDKYAYYVNINTSRTNKILGEKSVLIGGGDAEVTVDGLKLAVHPHSFFQVNDGVRQLLYSAVAALIEGESVTDAYSGAGVLSAIIAKRAAKVTAVEIEPKAVESARTLLERNGIGNVRLVCGDCARELPRLFTAAAQKTSTLVLDPPRSGCAREVLEAALSSRPQKIIYVSCNPATLARDTVYLTGGGYSITELTPFDMFPHSANVETLVVLSKKTPDSHINIDVEFGEGEGQFSLSKVKERAEARKPKVKVTYKMIQDYIEQTYGFKVHTAYIAEVKRDLGLPMYDAPNAVEELKRPRAHPTPKMVEAIKETLKHFEII